MFLRMRGRERQSQTLQGRDPNLSSYTEGLKKRKEELNKYKPTND